MQGIALLLDLEHARRCGKILLFIERLLEALTSLSHFLLDLLIVFCQLILDEHICTIALLRVAVVDEGIVECIDVAAGLPDGRMHEDGAVDAHDVLVEQHHGLPPILLDIVLQFNTILTVVIDGAESVVDLT